MILGIWNNNNVTLKQLYEEGFRGVRIATTWQGDDTLDKYIDRMIKQYIYAKGLGFEKFLIDYGQGYGKYENPPNYNWKYVYDRFRMYMHRDCVFHVGEPYELLYESKILTKEQFVETVEDKINYAENKIFIDATKRNVDKIYAMWSHQVESVAVSSYYKQETEWHSVKNAIWIFGQFAWHNLFGSLNYEKLFNEIKKRKYNKINEVWLYQGNPANWSAEGWENKLIRTFMGGKYLINCEEKRRREFINVFGKLK